MKMFTKCLETIWKENLQNAPIKPSNCSLFLTPPEIVFKIEKIPVYKMSSRLHVMRHEDVYIVCFLEMLPLKHLHNVFKRITWKCFIDGQKLASCLKTPAFKTSLFNLQIIRFEIVYKVCTGSSNWTHPKRIDGASKLSMIWRCFQLSFRIIGVAISHIQSSTEYVWNTASIMQSPSRRPED